MYGCCCHSHCHHEHHQTGPTCGHPSLYWDQVTGERRTGYPYDPNAPSPTLLSPHHTPQYRMCSPLQGVSGPSNNCEPQHEPRHHTAPPPDGILRNHNGAIHGHIPRPLSTGSSGGAYTDCGQPPNALPTPPRSPRPSPTGSPAPGINISAPAPLPVGSAPPQPPVQIQTFPTFATTPVQMQLQVPTPAFTPISTFAPINLGSTPVQVPVTAHLASSALQPPAQTSVSLHPPVMLPSNWASVSPAGKLAWTPVVTGALPIITTTQVGVTLCPWLMPNPTNPNAPSLIWDIFLYPTVAKRITGRNTVVDLAPKFRDPATHPAVAKVVILCDAGMAGDFWGPIVIERDNVVTVRDILFGIYEYYQTAMSEEEVQYVASLDPDNYTKMTDACYRRCEGTPALPGYVLRQGLKRVDCLGGKTTFHGIWVTMNPDSTWQMNLSLIGNRRRV